MLFRSRRGGSSVVAQQPREVGGGDGAVAVEVALREAPRGARSTQVLQQNRKVERADLAVEIKVAGDGTGLRKFGAALGDGVSVGCNAVLSPGTVVGKGAIIYHGATVRGVVSERTVVKLRQELEEANLHR